MKKRLLSLLLTLALLGCGAAALGEPSSALSAARISSLQSLAGESGAAWSEGTPPSKGMNAFQMWQWTDWFLSNEVRSVLGAVQDLEQRTRLSPRMPNGRCSRRKTPFPALKRSSRRTVWRFSTASVCLRTAG